MKDVSKYTNLVRRGQVYYFRCRVPADLSDHYGKREIKRSLRTSDHREALERVRLEALRQGQEFVEVRRRQNPEQRVSLSVAEIDRLAASLSHSVLTADEDIWCYFPTN